MVYPRACGGTMSPYFEGWDLQGLSPRVRGNPFVYLSGSQCVGSIPARAGEPIDGCACLKCHRVYPRACGGTCSTIHAQSTARGLSPRVRGNPRQLARAHLLIGSIPARAGEPTQTVLPALFSRVYPRACGGTRLCRRLHRLGLGLSPRVRGNLAANPDAPERKGSIPARAGEP